MQKEVSKIDWSQLLDDKTISAIKFQGDFVGEHEISSKLLQEVALPEFAEVFKIGVRKVDKDAIDDIGKRGGFVFEGKMLDALMNEKPADARRRLRQWIEDDGPVAKLPEISDTKEIKEILNGLAQAVKKIGSPGEPPEPPKTQEAASGK